MLLQGLPQGSIHGERFFKSVLTAQDLFMSLKRSLGALLNSGFIFIPQGLFISLCPSLVFTDWQKGRGDAKDVSTIETAVNMFNQKTQIASWFYHPPPEKDICFIL